MPKRRDPRLYEQSQVTEPEVFTASRNATELVRQRRVIRAESVRPPERTA